MYLSETSPRLNRYRDFGPVVAHGPFDGLGQLIPDSVVDQIAEKLVNKADPKVRQIISEEKVKLSEAIKPGIPMAGVSILAFLGTHFLIPQDKKTFKFVGYATSTAIFFTGAWLVAEEMKSLSSQVAPKKK